MNRFDIRASFTKRKPLLTRRQLERLNGGPLPLLTVTVWKPRFGPVLCVTSPEEGQALLGGTLELWRDRFAGLANASVVTAAPFAFESQETP